MGCELCPRRCGTNRAARRGYCGAGDEIRVCRAALHHWEEPCVSGFNGSGTVFFPGCTLGCAFCQNREISRNAGAGLAVSRERLAEIFKELRGGGAHNINLVSPTPYMEGIAAALELARPDIPIISNNGGYERVSTLERFAPYIDVYLADMKFCSAELSAAMASAPDYFAVASRAITAMHRLVGAPQYSETESPKASGSKILLLRRGLLVRHLVLPGHTDDSIRLLEWMHANLPADGFILSLMSQYTPAAGMSGAMARKLTTYEYRKVTETALDMGFKYMYGQQRTSAKEEYTPPFDLTGVSGGNMERPQS